LSVVEAHRIAVDTEHRLVHEIPRLTSVIVHAEPLEAAADQHSALDHHG
jgi:divalent metal cation (Fe/Co/Zn/Cd) transporter